MQKYNFINVVNYFKMNRNILIFLITISFYEFCFCYPQCLNENGEVIDWYTILIIRN